MNFVKGTKPHKLFFWLDTKLWLKVNNLYIFWMVLVKGKMIIAFIFDCDKRWATANSEWKWHQTGYRSMFGSKNMQTGISVKSDLFAKNRRRTGHFPTKQTRP